MRKVGLLLIALLLLGWTMTVTRAQEALTQTYTAKDGSYSLMYPSAWQVIDAEKSLIAQTDNSQVVGVFFEYLPKSGSLKDAVTQTLLDNIGQGAAGADFVFKDTQVGSYPAAQFEAGNSTIVLTGYALDAGNGQAFVGIVYGMTGVMDTFGPTFDAVMASFKPGAGGSSAPTLNAAPTTEAPTVVPTVDVAALPAAPDGTQSEFTFSGSDGDAQANFMIDPAGKVTQITHSPGGVYYASLSPDGRRLAFISYNPAERGGQQYIDVVDPSGDNPVQLKPTQVLLTSIAWSPDSKQLLYEAQANSSQPNLQPGIYKINADGTGETRLPLDGIDASTLSSPLLDWSPDGKRIVFSAAVQGSKDLGIFFADADGTNVTPGPAIDVSGRSALFRWSPDGQHALISSYDSLTVSDADGSNANTIIPRTELLSIQAIAWSPDSQQIAFEASKYPDNHVGLYVMKPDGSNRQEVDTSQQPLTLGMTGLSWGFMPVDVLRSDAITSTGAASVATPTTESAAAAPTAVADTQLVTATAGKYTVSVRIPTTPGVTVRDFSRDSIDLSMTGISIIGFDVDVQFPPSVSGGTTAKTMLESKLSYAKGPITEFQVDGREAARLDAENRDASEYVYMIVKTAAGDYVDVEFTVLVDKKEEVEPAMLALLASVTTGDPNAQPAAQPTTDGSAAPPTETGAAAATVSCSVTANGTANLRSGPGTSFAKSGSLAAGTSQSVTGQATGSDGKVWYQLDGGSYVRSDLVAATGECDSVPTVTP